MTKHECTVVMAYTGIAMLQGEDLHYFYAYLSEISGRNIYTHEIPAVISHYRDSFFQVPADLNLPEYLQELHRSGIQKLNRIRFW